MSSRSRTLVLTFDGTGNQFGNNNSNVVRFFRALKKDEPTIQMAYYQAGIGTYSERQFLTSAASTMASALDQAVALHLNDHVKEGYKYLMQNYRKGDMICLFGFSRGAYTARALSGMLYKVGLLPPYNDEQLDFAFKIFQSTDQKASEMSKEFKDTFAIPVTVEFVGVWDTVSSVGIIPRTLPYSSVNYAVKTFRHALALDERRARFRPNIWNEPGLGREELNDVPNMDFRGDTPRDSWVFQPPNRDFTDVKEVWFAGCHADVGGGSHDNSLKESLSGIPLRWMIEECMTKTDIIFDYDYLRKDLGLDIGIPKTSQVSASNSSSTDSFNNSASIQSLSLSIPSLGFPSSSTPSGSPSDGSPGNESGDIRASDVFSATTLTGFLESTKLVLRHVRDKIDAIAPLFDQLVKAPSWWVLEFLPMLSTYQREDGTWIRQRVRNFGRGRYIPYHNNEIQVHLSVLEKMQKDKTYRPSAYNWDIAEASNMIKWVV